MVFLKTYNFFPSIPPTQDQHQLRNQLISTRLFIILLTLSLTILLLYNSLITITQTNTVTFPTITTYLQLYSEYPQSLSCDCKQISINHDKFLHITYTFHEICSSAFTTSRWLDYLTDARPDMTLFRDDFRASSGIAVFQTLITFCDLSSETVENRLSEFYSSQFVSASLLPSELFYLEIESLITQFISTTTNTFLLSLSSIRQMTQGNVLLSATLTNYEFVPLSNHYFLSNPYTYDNCSCSLSGSCFEPYSIFNGLDRTVILYTVPGMNAACYPVEAVLQSDLRCFYNQTCIIQVQSYFNESSPMNVSALDPSLLGEFMVESTMEDVVKKLMVVKWNESILYENYFNECAVRECRYVHETKNDALYIITTIIGLIGGLITILKLTVPRFVTLTMFFIRKYRMRYNRNQIMPLTEN
ncbi:unnamed protein product [Adineta ricciae]|uniref:Transmembrane protein n=1 Tax=Adineta ricciae TaxID=249248 RepID=A0A815MQD4_ADIRI|nr:unnamed protein product [Adineta ricciae]